MPRESLRKFCKQRGCTAFFMNHFWGKMRAQDSGWFMQYGDINWCPEHNPSWVAEWRRKKKETVDGNS